MGLIAFASRLASNMVLPGFSFPGTPNLPGLTNLGGNYFPLKK